MPKQIAIIGSNAFLARWLYKELKQPDTVFQLWGRRLGKADERAIFHYYSFPEKPLEYSKIAQADAVIFAAATGVQANDTLSEEAIFELNAFEPIRLALNLKQLNFTGQLFTFGSYFEIGASNEKGRFTEEMIVSARFAAVTPYIRSKRLLTRFFSDFSSAFTFQHLILPTIYGPGENPNRLIPSLLKAGTEKQSVRLTGGNQVRQYLYVSDLCKLISELTETPSASGIYNVSCRDELPIAELVDQVKQVVPFSIDTETGTLARADTAMPFLRLDDSKLKSRVSWQPVTSVKQAVQQYFSSQG